MSSPSVKRLTKHVGEHISEVSKKKLEAVAALKPAAMQKLSKHFL